jgi:hypothetical protein
MVVRKRGKASLTRAVGRGKGRLSWRPWPYYSTTDDARMSRPCAQRDWRGSFVRLSMMSAAYLLFRQ